MLYPIELWVQCPEYQPLAMLKNARVRRDFNISPSDCSLEDFIWQTTIRETVPPVTYATRWVHYSFQLFLPAAAEGLDEADGGGEATAG